MRTHSSTPVGSTERDIVARIVDRASALKPEQTASLSVLLRPKAGV